MENMQESLVKAIIKEQSLIIGESLARNRAEMTGSVTFTSDTLEEVHLDASNPKSAIEKLIQSYEEVFGQASVEVCISVIKRYPLNEVQSLIPDKIKLAL